MTADREQRARELAHSIEGCAVLEQRTRDDEIRLAAIRRKVELTVARLELLAPSHRPVTAGPHTGGLR